MATNIPLVDRLRELEEKATPVPWNTVEPKIGTWNLDRPGAEDLALIVEMRNSLPALLRAVEAMFKIEAIVQTIDVDDIETKDGKAAIDEIVVAIDRARHPNG